MVVILDDSPTLIDMDVLAKEMKTHGLPSYARPCSIRLTKKIELTGEFANHFSLLTDVCSRCF